MKPSFKLLSVAAALPLALAGCVSPNPKAAFDDVDKLVAERSGHHLHWVRDDAERGELEARVRELLAEGLTAQRCVAIALLNNRALRAEFESVGVSQAELAQASRPRNPEISGAWTSPTSAATGLKSDYSLAQDLLDLLTLPARKKIAARQLEGVKLRVAHEALKLGEEVQSAFHTAQARQQFARRLAMVAAVNEAAADIAARQFRAGNINTLDLRNQEAAHAQSRLELAKAEAQLRSDRERLNRLLGLWGAQTEWELKGDLPPLPASEPPLENLESIAVSRRLDLAAARGNVVAVASALRLKRSTRGLPGVSVGVSAEGDLDHSWVAGPTLALELPLFDQGQAQVAKLAAEYRRAKSQFEALAVEIRSEVREARDALVAARDAAEFHEKVLVPQRRMILRETLLHYNAMQLSNFELLLAKEREQLGEREAIEALRDYWLARASLERALGGAFARADIPVNPTPPLAAEPETTAESHHH